MKGKAVKKAGLPPGALVYAGDKIKKEKGARQVQDAKNWKNDSLDKCINPKGRNWAGLVNNLACAAEDKLRETLHI